MKRKVKAFTLIECLVSLAVLGVASLLLVQAYTQLMKTTKTNAVISSSIGQQMADAEARNDSNVKKYIDDKDFKVKMEKSNNQNYTVSNDAYKTTDEFASTIDVYAVKAYKSDSNGAGTHAYADTDTDNGADVRYVYFHK